MSPRWVKSSDILFLPSDVEGGGAEEDGAGAALPGVFAGAGDAAAVDGDAIAAGAVWRKCQLYYSPPFESFFKLTVFLLGISL